MLKGKAAYLSITPQSDCQRRFHPKPTKCGGPKALFTNIFLNIWLEEINALTVIAEMLCISVLSDHIG